MSYATITAAHPTHWEVTALGAHVTVRDTRHLADTAADWLVHNAHGQSLPHDNPVAAAAIAAVAATAA